MRTTLATLLFTALLLGACSSSHNDTGGKVNVPAKAEKANPQK